MARTHLLLPLCTMNTSLLRTDVPASVSDWSQIRISELTDLHHGLAVGELAQVGLA